MTDSPYQYAPPRLCDTCLTVDGDPRHVFGVRGDQAEQVTYTEEQRKQAVENAGGDSTKVAALLRDLMDSGTQSKHLDCCLSDGCPDGTCQRKLEDPDDPFDGGTTTGPALSKKFAARVEALSKNQEK